MQGAFQAIGVLFKQNKRKNVLFNLLVESLVMTSADNKVNS